MLLLQAFECSHPLRSGESNKNVEKRDKGGHAPVKSRMGLLLPTRLSRVLSCSCARFIVTVQDWGRGMREKNKRWGKDVPVSHVHHLHRHTKPTVQGVCASSLHSNVS